MHPEAYDWVAAHAPAGTVGLVVECGGRDINGSVRPLFNAERYIAVDLVDGPGVDVVADWLDWQPDTPADVVVHCEVAEHTPHWAAHLEHAASILRPGGLLILTCAGPRRHPHSGIDGNGLHPGEYYRNIDPNELCFVLGGSFTEVEVDVAGRDVRAWARSRRGRLPSP